VITEHLEQLHILLFRLWPIAFLHPLVITMPTDDDPVHPSNAASLHDDFVFEDFYEMAFSDELETGEYCNRKAFNHEPLPAHTAYSSNARSYEAIQIMNYTSHIFRGLASTTLQFIVRILPEYDLPVKTLLDQKKLYAEVTLTSPRKIGDSENIFTSQQAEQIGAKSEQVKYKWRQDARSINSRSVTNSRNSDKISKKQGVLSDINDKLIRIDFDKDGKLNYVVTLDVPQEFLSTQANHYDIDFARKLSLESIEAIHLLVELKNKENLVIATACSFPIYVTNFAFSIEERFSSSPYVKKLANRSSSEDASFAWYSKNGGDNASIDIAIHLRDSKGRFVKDHDVSIPTTTQLVYADGSPAPELPLAPLKVRNTTSTSSCNTLFRRIRTDPVLLPKQASVDFGFRIEEVSMHHLHRGGGFRVRVYTDEPMLRYLVSPGMLEEIIIVRSKAKKGELPYIASNAPFSLQQVIAKLKQSSCSMVKTEVESTAMHTRKARKISLEYNISPIKIRSDVVPQCQNIATIPTTELFRCLYNHNGRCLGCGKEANESNFGEKHQHLLGCVLSSSFPEKLKNSPFSLFDSVDHVYSNIQEGREPDNEAKCTEEERLQSPDDFIPFDFVADDVFSDTVEEQRTCYNPREYSARNEAWLNSTSGFDTLDYSSPNFPLMDKDTCSV